MTDHLLLKERILGKLGMPVFAKLHEGIEYISNKDVWERYGPEVAYKLESFMNFQPDLRGEANFLGTKIFYVEYSNYLRFLTFLKHVPSSVWDNMQKTRENYQPAFGGSIRK